MSSDGVSATPAGWYRDPAGGGNERYFDGTGWTAEVRSVELRRRTRPAAPPTQTVTVAQPTAAAATVAVAERPAPTSTATAAATPPLSPPVSRRSLADALARPVDERSAQRLLLGTATTLTPRTLRTSDGPTPAGWYPDPARGGALRFFDGTRWTSRTRPASDTAVRHLPTAALKLRARFLAAQDAAALRRGDRPRRSERLRIPQATSAPSLTTHTRSGSMWGMLSTMLMVVGLVAAAVLAWQLWGSDYYNVHQQNQLEEQLAQQPVDAWGTVPVVVEQAPAATAGAAPGPGADDRAETTRRKRKQRPQTGEATSPQRRGDGQRTRRPTATDDRAPRADVQPAAAETTQRVRIVDNPNTDGRPVGRIRIPRIGLTRVFVLGTEAEQLALGPGLWKWGAFPGTPGNTTISGHRTTHGAPFRHLDKLKVGDRIYINVPGRRRAVYEVRGTTIADPFDVRVTKQTAGVRLTLTTCHPVGSAAERMVVQAELIAGEYIDQALPRPRWRLLR